MNRVSVAGSAFAANKYKKCALALCVASAFTSVALQAEEEAGEYEKVIVTGQKINRTLQETTTSVAVINSVQMAELDVSDLSDALHETANVSTAGSNGFNIRGIDSFKVSDAGTSALASVYVDGSPLPQRVISNGFSTWDINQIEIFRGPQSSIQGRNALAGAIIMTSAAPTQEWEGKYKLQLGQHGETKAAVAFGGGLVEDELSFRFSGERNHIDGFNYNTVRNEHSDSRTDELYRLKLLYTPSALPEFSAQLSVTHYDTFKGLGNVEAPPANTSTHDHRIVTNNDPQRLRYRGNILGLNLTYDLNDNWAMTAVTTYSKLESGWRDYDDDNGPVAAGTRYFIEDSKTLTQEVRFNFEYDKLEGVIGGYYFDQELPQNYGGTTRVSLASVGLSQPILQARFGLDAATAGFVLQQYAGLNPIILQQTNFAQQDITTKAIFADATYSLNDQWDVFAGLRWDHENHKNNDIRAFTVPNISAMPNPANYQGLLRQLITGINAQLNSNITSANNTAPIQEDSFSALIPKIGVSRHWNDDVTTSFTVQRGYRSGGVGVNTVTSQVYKYDPEYTTNYELSLRSTWLDGALTVNANLFHIDWTDQQVNEQRSANTFDTVVANAGKSRVQGVELETSYQLNSELKLFAALGLAKTEFTEYLKRIPTQSGDIVRDLSGRPFADSPEWTSNIGAIYRNDNGWFASASLNYADSSVADVDPAIRGLSPDSPLYDVKNEGRTLVNMQFGYEWENVGIYLIGRNVFDKEYISRAAFGLGRRVVRQDLGAPRQVSLSIRGNF